MSDEQAATMAVEVLDLPAQGPSAPLAPVQADYRQAIEFGKVAAESRLYPSAATAAKAAMVCAMGMALGVDPPVALTSIHIFEDSKGRISFLIEGKLLAALIGRTPGVEFEILRREGEEVEIEFRRGGKKAGPNLVWDKARAIKAGLWSKPGPWQNYPLEMLTWRALAEGTRLYAAEVLAGQSIYVRDAEDLGGGSGQSMSDALGDTAPPALADEKAEALRKRMQAAYDRLREANPKRLAPGLFARMMRDASYSHTQLEAEAVRLEDLATKEQTLNDQLAELEPLVDDATFKEVAGRIDRAPSAEARVQRAEEALIIAKEATPDEG